MGLRGEKVTEEWGLWLVAIYTELVFEAVPGRWRIAFGVYTTRLAALKFAKVSLQEEVQYCEAELKSLRQKRILRNSKRSWRRTRDF